MLKEDAPAIQPAQSELHYWADFFEFYAAVDPDGHYSAKQLADLAQSEADLIPNARDSWDVERADVVQQLAGLGNVSLLELAFGDLENDGDAGFDSLTETDSDDPDQIEYLIGRQSEQREKSLAWCRDVFLLLLSRELEYGDAYPFDVRDDVLALRRRPDRAYRLAYLFLLMASCLNQFTSSALQTVTAAYERLSFTLMRAMFPSPARVRHFGTSAAEGAFSGTLWEKINSLGKELRLTLRAEERMFSPHDTGDGGLDLVAWLPMLDNAEGVIVYLGQCACGKDWEDKQWEVSAIKWSKTYIFGVPPVSLLFVPHHLRTNNGDWYDSTSISLLVVDRLRGLRIMERDRIPLPGECVELVRSVLGNC